MTLAQLYTFARIIDAITLLQFIHGDCIGADAQAHALVRAIKPDVLITIRPCNIEVKRAHCEANTWYSPEHPLKRNREIANHCDLLLATPKTAGEELRSGTWATIRYARSYQKTIAIIDPYGRVDIWQCKQAGREA